MEVDQLLENIKAVDVKVDKVNKSGKRKRNAKCFADLEKQTDELAHQLIPDIFTRVSYCQLLIFGSKCKKY